MLEPEHLSDLIEQPGLGVGENMLAAEY